MNRNRVPAPGNTPRETVQRSAELGRGRRHNVYSSRTRRAVGIIGAVILGGSSFCLTHSWGEDSGYPGVSAKEAAQQKQAIIDQGIERRKGFYCNTISTDNTARLVGGLATFKITAEVGNPSGDLSSVRLLFPGVNQDGTFKQEQDFRPILTRPGANDLQRTVVIRMNRGVADGLHPVIAAYGEVTTMCAMGLRTETVGDQLNISLAEPPTSYPPYEAPADPNLAPTSPAVLPNATLSSPHGELTLPAGPSPAS